MTAPLKHPLNPDRKFEKKDAEVVPQGNGGDDLETKNALESFFKGFEEFKSTVEKELKAGKETDPLVTKKLEKLETELQESKATVEKLRLEQARSVRSADETKDGRTPDQVEYEKKFYDYFTTGAFEDGNELRNSEQKALSAGVDPDGGYMVPTQMESGIDRVITELSAMRSICRVIQVGTGSYKKVISMGGATVEWVGETTEPNETDTPTLRTLEVPTHEMSAMPAATNTLLQDAAFNADSWLADEVALSMAVEEGQVFINGSGANKPRGILSQDMVDNDSWSWGKIGYVPTGVSGDFKNTDPGDAQDNLIDLIYSLKPIFRSNARWILGRDTLATVRKLKDADGRLLWTPDMRAGETDRLLGYPVTEMVDMPDIAADSYSLGFGDFRRGYTIVDRVGIRVLRDPYTSKPYIKFYTTKRVGGDVTHFEAYKLMKFGTS